MQDPFYTSAENIARAREHIDRDIRTGRDWQCGCATCRLAREIEATPAGKERWPGGLEIDERFARLARLETRHDALRKIADSKETH